MDARKINAVNKICEEITKSVIPHGFTPDFSDLRDGKGMNDFNMKISFGDRSKNEKAENQMDLMQQ